MTYSARICKDCLTEIFVDVNMVVVNDALWLYICDKLSDDICDKCMEARLGRSITETDFKKPAIKGITVIPCNKLWLDYKQQQNKKSDEFS